MNAVFFCIQKPEDDTAQLWASALIVNMPRFAMAVSLGPPK
jgi:hypothetical protein